MIDPHALHVGVDTDNSQIESTFDAITYVKGGAVLSMIESYVGAETFRRGVQRHLRNHEHGVATSEEFFSAMAQAANQPAVMAAFRSFVDQPGVPLVSLDQTMAGTQQRNATQVRYLPIGTSLSGGERWQIPLCVHAYAGAGPPAKACTLLRRMRAG